MSSDDDLIFVSIASYRDPQLEPTIADCLAKALHPARLRFGICWQRGEDEIEPAYFRDDPRFRVLTVDWRASKGVCWARAEIMKLRQQEKWFFQVDSHCRFVHGWDTKLIEAAAQTGANKPLLSTYPNSFKPGRHEILTGAPTQIIFQAFTPEGIPQLKPGPFTTKGNPDHPVPARFLAAGFLFADSRFAEEVAYDPSLYFLGEEITMAVRAYTHGFDLFHPADVIVWHDYFRFDSKRHWDDHTAANDMPVPGSELDRLSRARVQRLLKGEPVEDFGLGEQRTLAEYEAYAGLSFRLHKAHPYTVRGEPPPNPDPSPDWAEQVQPWIVKIALEYSQLPAGAFDDPALWSLTVDDEDGQQICRIDATQADIQHFRDADGPIILTCEFPSTTAPATWGVQPLSRSNGWLPKITGTLSAEDFAILADDDEDEL